MIYEKFISKKTRTIIDLCDLIEEELLKRDEFMLRLIKLLGSTLGVENIEKLIEEIKKDF